jgi:hypothetical protein
MFDSHAVDVASLTNYLGWGVAMHSQNSNGTRPAAGIGRLTKAWLVLGLAWSGIAAAHHSFAMFDTAKLVTFQGVVKQWAWVNPHSWLYIEVPKADGTVETWGFECSSPNMMIRWGWNKDDIHVGDKITIDAHAARDGKHVASVKTLFLSSGKVLADPMGQGRPVSGDELATGIAVAGTKPMGVEYK